MNKKTIVILSVIGALIVIALTVLLIMQNIPQKPGNDTTITDGNSSAGTVAEQTNDTTVEDTHSTDHVGGLDISFGTDTIPGGVREPVATKPTTPDKTPPETTTEGTTEGSSGETTEGTTAGDVPVKELTYEEYEALSAQAQYEYAMSLGVEAYIKWKHAAVADYNARHPDETISADGPVIDLSGKP